MYVVRWEIKCDCSDSKRQVSEEQSTRKTHFCIVGTLDKLMKPVQH